MKRKYVLSTTLLIVLLLLSLIGCSAFNNLGNLTKISSYEGRYTHPRWSEDGETILFQFEPNEGVEQQFVTVNSDGEEWNKLDISSPSDFAIDKPDWWDENHIAYIVDNPNSPLGEFWGDLVIHDLNSGESDIVSTNHTLIFDTCWTKSGNSITYIEGITHDVLQDGSSLKILDLQSNKTTTIVQGEEWFFLENLACNSLKEQVAYTFVDISSRPHKYSLIIEDIESGERKTLIGPIQAIIGDLTWSPDGDWLAVQMFGDTPETKYQAGIVLVATDGSEQVKVDGIQERIFPQDLDWSPAGNKLVMTSLDGVGRYSMHVLDIGQWITDDHN